MNRIACAIFLLIVGAQANAIDFVKESIPEKWYTRVTPEEGEPLEFPNYYDALDKARGLMSHGRYRAALMALAKLSGTDREAVALIRATCLHATGRHDEATQTLSD